MLPFLAETSALPHPTGDSRIDWINMLGWLLVILTNAGLAVGIARRKPPVGEDLAHMRSEMDARRADHVSLKERVEALEEANENAMNKVERRLKEGDDLFRNHMATLSGVKSTVEGLGTNMHMVQLQVAEILQRLPRMRN